MPLGIESRLLLLSMQSNGYVTRGEQEMMVKGNVGRYFRLL
jgi:hypothetical protein